MIAIVRFVRRDGKPDEEYYYRSLEEAEYHFHLFEDDDSNLYIKIIIETYDSAGKHSVEEMLF